MTLERWQYIERLYHAALARDTDEQAAFLAEACAGDEALRGEVESLLRCDTRAGRFIESPALEVAAQLCAEDRVQSMIGRLIGPNDTTPLRFDAATVTKIKISPGTLTPL